jgi:hypothetical protein
MTAPRCAFLEQLPLQRYPVRLLKKVRATVSDPAEVRDIVQNTRVQRLESIGEDDSLPDGSGATDREWDDPAEDAAGARSVGWFRCVSRRRAADAVRSRDCRQERLADYRSDSAHRRGTGIDRSSLRSCSGKVTTRSAFRIEIPNSTSSAFTL